MAIEKVTDAEIVDLDFFVDNNVKISSGPGEVPKKNGTTQKKVNPRKKGTEVAQDGTEVVNTHTIDSYMDNMSELKKTVIQMDSLAGDLKQDLDVVRSSRTLKGKYQYTSLISSNIATLLSAKVQAIKEMNNTIKNSIELDYRIEKDRKDAMNGDDDKRIMDMYNAFVSAPVSSNRMQLGPTEMQLSLPGSGVQYASRGPIRGTEPVSSTKDPGFDNYMNTLSPEQNLMMYEDNPDIKLCVVYNKATGDRKFEVMNTKTGQVVPNVAKRDAMFLDDTVIDTRRKVARNANLGESYPLIIVGDETNPDMKGF